MIYSDKQYTISSAQRSTLQEALAAAKERASGQAWLKQAEIDGLKSQIADIDAELAEYDLLKSGQVSFSKTYALEELPRVLVQASLMQVIANTYSRLGLNPRAEPLLRTAFATQERLLGPDAPATARTRRDLGVWYQDAGRYDEARP